MDVDGAAAAGAAASAKPLTPEEEALRRNTDCVYFLASPLTCKKGNECDFRHSEGARMNPRDCWYWMKGNCLNPKCSFRHPPIDGLFGAPTPGAPSVSSHYGAYNLGKQMVPCYYFQKGSCIKGDRCPFYHGPQAAGNNPPEQVVKVSSFPLEQPQSQKSEVSPEPNNSIQQRVGDRSKMAVDLSMVHAAKIGVAAVPSEPASNAVKSRLKSEKVPNNTPAVNKSLTTSEEDQPVCYRNQLPVQSDPAVQDWNQDYQMPPADDLPQNSREADDFLGESSPGFDVLVDNDAGGAAYLHDEEDFGRDMYSVEDYEYAPADFDIQAHHERERFNGMGGHNQIGQLYDGYERKRRRSSSERSIDRPFNSDRGFPHREIGHAEMDRSDLRHQLRRRRINGSSTAISPERNGEQHRRDEHFRERAHGGHHTHRDRHQGPRGSTLSSRLLSRIKLPGRSPDRVDTRFENERDRKRLRDRLSPVRHVNFHGFRHREAGQHLERSQRRSTELASSVRHADGHSSRRDVDSVHLTSHKNLREPRKVNGIMESEASLDFEGPKPLSVILQRKRDAAVGNNSSSSYEKSAEAAVRQPCSLVEAEKKDSDNIISSEGYKSGSGDEEYKEEDDQVPVEGQGQSSSHGDKYEVEDITGVDPTANQEADNYEQREGESDDYETIEGHDYKSEDENAYPDDEDFDDDDDDDDFARKVGVVFS